MRSCLDSFPEFQKKTFGSKEQNNVFMDAVKSLTGHIEELLEHNENFMKHVRLSFVYQSLTLDSLILMRTRNKILFVKTLIRFPILCKRKFLLSSQG